MKKLVLLALLGVVLVAAGCKKNDVQPTSDNNNGAATTAGSGTDSQEPTFRGDTQAHPSLQTVFFDFDKSDLSDASMSILKANAQWLLDNPTIKVVVQGNTDSRGTAEYNLSLGQRRATAVRQIYIQLGVSGDRIATISYGKENPVDPTDNDAAWAKNRRADTRIQVKK